MVRDFWLGAGLVVVLGAFGIISWRLEARNAAPVARVPSFEEDQSWPKALPNHWRIGQDAGVATDAQDHVWIVQHPDPSCCNPTPPVLELDADGKLINAWGGREGFEWLSAKPSITVDSEGYIWIPDNRGHAQKFTQDGTFVMQVGLEIKGPAGAEVESKTAKILVGQDPDNQEVYVAAGEGVHRMAVYDALTGMFKRGWGAFEDKPDRVATHCAEFSNDGFLYMCAGNNFVQVFQLDGTLVKEGSASKNGAVVDIALSRDAQQKYIYVADTVAGEIFVMRRDKLEVLGALNRKGVAAPFHGLSGVVTDSQGNLYTCETQSGKPLRKFRYTGVVSRN